MFAINFANVFEIIKAKVEQQAVNGDTVRSDVKILKGCEPFYDAKFPPPSPLPSPGFYPLPNFKVHGINTPDASLVGGNDLNIVTLTSGCYSSASSSSPSSALPVTPSIGSSADHSSFFEVSGCSDLLEDDECVIQEKVVVQVKAQPVANTVDVATGTPSPFAPVLQPEATPVATVPSDSSVPSPSPVASTSTPPLAPFLRPDSSPHPASSSSSDELAQSQVSDFSDLEDAVIVQVQPQAVVPLKFTQPQGDWFNLDDNEIGLSAQELWGLPLTADVRVLKCLGQGGFGAVFKVLVSDDGMAREMALKVMNAKNKDAVAGFVAEVNSSLKLQALDERVARVRLHFETKWAAFTVYDYYPVGDLTHFNLKYELKPTDIFGIFKELSVTLAEIHKTGVVHADIKPDNILMDYRDTGFVPVVADLGLSIFGSAVEGCGTRGYMAPEVWASGVEWGKAADVFALGATIYQLMTGSEWWEMYEERWSGALVGAGPGDECWNGFEADDIHTQLMMGLVASCLEPCANARVTASALVEEFDRICKYEEETGGSLVNDPPEWIQDFLVGGVF